MAIGMGALALLAAKALMVGKLALMLSAIIGLKALTHHGHHESTHEIIAKPIYTHHDEYHGGHSGYGGGYGRSMNFELPEHLQN